MRELLHGPLQGARPVGSPETERRDKPLREKTLFLAARALSFLAVPATYLLLGLLNYSQAGKTAALGTLALLAAAAWRADRSSPPGGKGWLLEPLVALPFLLLLAVQAFLRAHYGVAHDDEIVVEAVFNATAQEVREFLQYNGRSIGRQAVLLAFVLLAYGLLLRWGNRLLPAPGGATREGTGRGRPSLRLPAFFLASFVALHANPSLREDDPLLYAPLRYRKWSRNVEATRWLQARMADPAMAPVRYAGEGPRTVVFVLGESTTRRNWSLYGYPRETTPRLAELGGELARFDDVVTGFPGTAGSLRYLLTPADVAHPDAWMAEPDVVSLAKAAGYRTFWISNNGGRTGVAAAFASHADVARFMNRGGSRGEGSYDEVLLPPLREALADPAPRKFILLHALGGHPAFHFRYPKSFARFDGADDGVRRELSEKGRLFWAVRLRDEYDDAMLYADHVLRSTLDLCREREGEAVAWIFTPDHGEDVAHEGNFAGHNHRSRAMWEVPLLLWRSAAFPAPEVPVEEARRRPYQTDVLDHTLLGLLAVRTSSYDPRRDLLSRAFEPAGRSMAGVVD